MYFQSAPGPFHQQRLTVIPIWICIYINYCVEINCVSILKLQYHWSCWKWISNFIPCFIIAVITFSRCNKINPSQNKERSLEAYPLEGSVSFCKCIPGTMCINFFISNVYPFKTFCSVDIFFCWKPQTRLRSCWHLHSCEVIDFECEADYIIVCGKYCMFTSFCCTWRIMLVENGESNEWMKSLWSLPFIVETLQHIYFSWWPSKLVSHSSHLHGTLFCFRTDLWPPWRNANVPISICTSQMHASSVKILV